MISISAIWTQACPDVMAVDMATTPGGAGCCCFGIRRSATCTVRMVMTGHYTSGGACCCGGAGGRQGGGLLIASRTLRSKSGMDRSRLLPLLRHLVPLRHQSAQVLSGGGVTSDFGTSKEGHCWCEMPWRSRHPHSRHRRVCGYVDACSFAVDGLPHVPAGKPRHTPVSRRLIAPWLGIRQR